MKLWLYYDDGFWNISYGNVRNKVVSQDCNEFARRHRRVRNGQQIVDIVKFALGGEHWKFQRNSPRCKNSSPAHLFKKIDKNMII